MYMYHIEPCALQEVILFLLAATELDLVFLHVSSDCLTRIMSQRH